MEPAFEQDALAVNTYVLPEHGQWVVYVEVVFPNMVRRHRINAYRTPGRAELAARWIKRGADRPIRGTNLGF